MRRFSSQAADDRCRPQRMCDSCGVRASRPRTALRPPKSQTLPYQVRPQFSARFTCQRVNANAGCIPVLPVQLEFTAPVARGLASKIELRAADGKVHLPTIDPNVATVDSVEFKGPFAERSEATISLPDDLKDDAGRALANAAAFPMKVRIDDDPPLVKFPSRFGILEVNAQPALPVTVRNVEPTLDAYALDVAKAPRKSCGQGPHQTHRYR